MPGRIRGLGLRFSGFRVQFKGDLSLGNKLEISCQVYGLEFRDSESSAEIWLSDQPPKPIQVHRIPIEINKSYTALSGFKAQLCES